MHDLASATSERALRDYRALREAAAIVDLGDWTVLRLTGPDTAAFLNGTASQEIALAPGRAAREGLFLNEKGRPVALAWIALEPDGRSAWVLADAGAARTLKPHLERLRVMEDVAISGPEGMPRLLGAAGPAHLELAGSYATRERGTIVLASDPLAFLLRADEPTDPGGPESPSERPGGSGVEPVAAAAYEAWRLAVGLPRIGIDLDGDRIATELSRPSAISLTKGCYVGQEVVARTSGRGRVRRERVGFRFRWGGHAIAPRSELRAGGVPSGYVTSSAAEPGSADGLGMGYLSADALRERVSILALEGATTTHVEVAPWPL